MRLIDKAKLMNHIENESRNWGEDYDSYQILGDIEDFEIVEAIPISFIKKIIEDNRKQAIWEVRYLDDYEKHYARDKVNILKDLLELWEKENEAD